MSGHLAVELLSSYLDSEVSQAKLRLVEKHLDECSECRRTVAGLRAVSNGVRRLEAVAPPASLAASVERRVERASLEAAPGNRLEESLKRWMAQPVLAPVFAIVLALGAILYLFASGVAREEAGKTRLVIAAAPAESEREPLADRVAPHEGAGAAASGIGEAPSGAARQPAKAAAVSEEAEVKDETVTDTGVLEARGAMSRAAPARSAAPSADAEMAAALSVPAVPAGREIEGRRFFADGATWVESGLEDAIAEEVLDWRRLAESERAGLEGLRELGRVRVRIADRVVEVVYPEPEAPVD